MSGPDYLISTPENVDLHLELAGLGNRIMAAFIDYLLMYAIMIMIVSLSVLAFGIIEQMHMAGYLQSALYSYNMAVTLFLLFAIQFGYFIVFEGLWQGQTPGKRLAKIRVIESTGQALSWPAVIIRNLIRVVDIYLDLLGVLFIYFDKKQRRLGDFAAGSLVIKERSGYLAQNKIETTASLGNIALIDVGRISAEEYCLLTDFLKRREDLKRDPREHLALELRNYFLTKTQYNLAGEEPEEFLEQLYRAYLYQGQTI